MNENQDLDHLRLLSIFHLVVAALTALFALFPIIHVALGIAMVNGAMDGGQAAGNGPPVGPPPFFGWIFVVVGGLAILFGQAMAICMALAGRKLGRHTGYYFCMVVAGIECMMMPLGTLLGVFTIIVLVRPSVRQLFGVNQAP